MKYMLLMYGEESAWTADERRECMLESLGVCDELAAQGKFVAASPLHSVATATSVQIRRGQRLVTDGPFAETTEQLGGYYVIDVANLDEAIAVASRLPPARKGTVEIRPLHDVSGLSVDDHRDIVSRRDLPFSREEVFAAYADPQRLARWWGPAGFRNTFHEFHFVPGGDWRFVMHGPNGVDYDNDCVFRKIDRPGLIVFDHLSAPQFQMIMTLTQLGCRQSQLHWRMRFESPAARNAVAKVCVPCNEQNFDRLEAELCSAPSPS